jgi:site-specific DNA-adenine methylase
MRNFPLLGGSEERLALSLTPHKNRPIPWSELGRRILTVVPYTGGKAGLVPQLIPLIEWTAREYNLNTYVEATGGACRCLLNLDPSPNLFPYRVYSDVDYPLCCLFYVLSDEERTEQLIHRLSMLDYNERVFKAAVASRERDNELARLGKFEEASDDVTAAQNTYIAAMMSYAANMKSFNWKRAFEQRDQYYERVLRLHQFNPILSGVTFFRKDCRNLIREIETGQAVYDPKRCLIYADVPYDPNVMKGKKHYAYSWNVQDHINFREFIKNTETYMIICGYASKIYDVLVDKYGWEKIFLKMKHVSMSGTGRKEAEWVYFNFKISPELRTLISAAEQ